jgi:sec-independent protein translocase protein TatB
MGNLGGGEILVILLAALLFLGPQKLPEAARQIGKAMGEFRKVTSGFQRELRDAMNPDGGEAEARARGEAIAATRPLQDTTAAEQPSAPTADTAPVDDQPGPSRRVTDPGGGL